MSETLRGQLLVAAPILTDPNFHRTVVFVAEHGEEGRDGLVLNRPTETSVGDAVPELAAIAGEEEPLSSAARSRPARCSPSRSSMTRTTPPSSSSARSGSSRSSDVPVVRGRIFLGYAGWSAGQLESELEEESWLVLPAELDDLFSDDPRGSGAPCSAARAVRTLLSLMPPARR